MTSQRFQRAFLPTIPARVRLFVSGIACALMLAGCVTRFDIGDAARHVTPGQAVGDMAQVRGKTVAWGGVIVGTMNLADKTRLEVLAYPLDGRNRPEVEAKPTGRFIAFHPGFLEPVNFAAGRLLTVIGTVTGTLPGTVGEARYVYPVIEASRVFLWPTPEQEAAQPQFHFGVGVGISR
jgi:outer membrane lipoprotein